MSQLGEEIFEKLFKILIENDLIKVTNNIEETKKQAWTLCYPLIQELYKSNTDLYQFVHRSYENIKY